jgi:hypothetical protein
VDPFVVSRWVRKELGVVESVKVTCSGLVIFVCVTSGQREKVLCVTQFGSRSVSCFALRNKAPLKAVISGVALSVEVEQFKWKIPRVCDASCLVRLRPGGERGEK